MFEILSIGMLGYAEPYSHNSNSCNSKKKVYREQSKKCKSCKHFKNYETFCICFIGKRNNPKPIGIACEKYEKRNKK